MQDSFDSHGTLTVGDRTYTIARLSALADKGHDLARLPFSLRILLENLLRREDGTSVTAADIEALAAWKPGAPDREIAFMPARVLLQDFTGVPAVVDLAAMRDAVATLGGNPKSINPLIPAELVIDHSVQVDKFASPNAVEENARIEFERNHERYGFLRWGQTAFENFKVVPPDTGIVHQINLEFLARCVMGLTDETGGWAFPDTVVGTDSHTTMINGLGVLGWGVGGIEAEAAMLGQPVTMLIPDVVGFRLSGALPEGATATDLVLVVVEMLRKHGVVGKFVEFFGEGLAELPLADRATIANMAPEYGATCGIFPVDRVTIDYLRFSGRDEAEVALAEAYMKEQGLFCDAGTPDATYTSVVELDLATVVPSLAGPKRPQDRVALTDMKSTWQRDLAQTLKPSGQPSSSGGGVPVSMNGSEFQLNDGSVVIAAITSCTNTSNPSVMLAAGLVAQKARAAGLRSKPWVKTSMGPGSMVVKDYLERSKLLGPLEELGFHIVGYGCTTCIGNSGPLPEPVAAAIGEGDLVAASVLSGNRNFEGRVHQLVRANYLASPPLVVAYALAGTVDIDLYAEPLGTNQAGEPVFLKDIWPTRAEVDAAVQSSLTREMFLESYSTIYEGSEPWRALSVPEGDTFAWDASSTYVASPPFFDGITLDLPPLTDVVDARVLALLGDSITTDHISPAGAIKPDSPAGRYLQERGVAPADFNTYGSRRGNHDVMMRGTFANIRLRNLLVPGVEGGETLHIPSGEPMSIFDAAMRYAEEGTPLVVLAGAEYGTGSSRDWAAKGTLLLGARAVIATSFERIHRSNLIGMGVLPLEFAAGQGAESLGLTGHETISITGLPELLGPNFQGGGTLRVTATRDGASPVEFDAVVRIDTPMEADYYKNGGILHYVLRQLAAAK